MKNKRIDYWINLFVIGIEQYIEDIIREIIREIYLSINWFINENSIIKIV